MHGSINVKSPNNTSKWQMGFNSAFKGLTEIINGKKENGGVDMNGREQTVLCTPHSSYKHADK
jgi:hypothetical protein